MTTQTPIIERIDDWIAGVRNVQDKDIPIGGNALIRFLNDCKTAFSELERENAALQDRLDTAGRAVERWTNNAAGYAEKLDAAEAKLAQERKFHAAAIEEWKTAEAKLLELSYVQSLGQMFEPPKEEQG